MAERSGLYYPLMYLFANRQLSIPIHFFSLRRAVDLD